ncbi:MAG: IS1182 family transposase [Aggregatilineales bacterium]
MAHAAFKKGSPAMLIRDELACLYEDEEFSSLYADCGQPGISPWRLAVVTILQFMEGLSDRQAADAVRGRIDWKYALGLELEDTGFDASVLSEFRSRLVEAGLEYELLNRQLHILEARGYLKGHGRQRTDSTHMIAAVRSLNRLMNVMETVRHALNELSRLVPGWLQAHIEPEWYGRYGRRTEDSRLPHTQSERAALAHQIGQDGLALLKAVESVDAPLAAAAPSITVLRQIWAQQYDMTDGKLRWRKAEELPPNAELIMSPYDPEARQSVKRDTTWLGYKCHITETCDDEAPRLITHVETTPATTQDEQALMAIHTALQAKGLLPHEHLVDAGYTDSFRLAESQLVFNVDLVGPVSQENSWQAKTPDAFSTAYFVIDWEQKTVTCPIGHHAIDWREHADQRGQPLISTHFSKKTCAACPVRQRCTHSESLGRSLSFRPKTQQQALQSARVRQSTAEFKTHYAARAGVEGSFSQAVRLSDLRHSRYLGFAKTRLQQILTAVALNTIRIFSWLDEHPLARTRRSPFTVLAPAA